MEHRITLHRRLQILCGHAYEQRAFVLFIHFIEFYSIWLVLSWRQTVVINKEKKSHHKWGRKLLNTENEEEGNTNLNKFFHFDENIENIEIRV